MKKSLLLLFVCLFGALSGVKAWTNQSPSAGNTYYLYHPGQNQFLFVGLDDKYGVTPSVFNATPIYVETGGVGSDQTIFSFMIRDTKYYMYQNNGNADIKTAENEASKFEPKPNGDKYRLQTQRKDPWNQPVNYRCLHAGTSGGQCSFEQYNSSSNDGYEWQFISESEVESARNEMAESCASTAANYATTSNGWERVTSVSDLHTNPENYFFAFFSANATGLMLQASSNNAESQKLYYKTAVNPASGSQYLFEMKNHESGGFALKSCAIGKYFSNADYAWDFHANQTSATSGNYTNLTLTLANGAYTIETAQATNYVGLWTLITDWYSTNKYLAGNKQSSLAGSFLIYRIPKQRLRNVDFTQCITNPSFEAEDISAWSCTTGNDTGRKNNSGNYVMSNVAGSYLFNTWNDGIASEVSQTLSNMPSGFYTLSAVMASDNNETLRLKVGNDVIATSPATGAGDGIETRGSFSFSGGDMVIKADANNHWYKADNFRLTYLGGMEDLTSVSGKMNAAVNTAQQNAISTYNNNKTVANYIAATEAIANAEASVEAYANAASYLEKVESLLATTNFYSQAAYNSVYGTYKAAYDASTMEDATASGLNYKTPSYDPEAARYTDNTPNDLLIPGWTIGGNDASVSGSGFYINTWSTESAGSGDAADFANPFYEYYVGSGSLPAKVLSGTKTGLTPNTMYRVTANVRIQGTANSGKIKMQVGTGGKIDVTKGNQIGTTTRYIKDYVAVGKTDADGKLTLKFTVESESGISWLSFRDVMYAEQDDDFTYIIKQADCNTTSQEYWPGNGRTTATGEHYSGDENRVYFTFTSGEDRHQDVTFPATGKYLLKTAVRCKVANTVATMSVGDASATTDFASSKNCYVIGTDGSETTTVNSDGGGWVYNELYFDANAGDVKTITIHLTSKDNVGETDCGGMTLTYLGTEGTLVGMEVSAVAKAGTFVAPFDVVIPARTTAYTVKAAGNGYITLEEKAAAGETLAANTPVILYAEDGIASKISKQFYGTATGSENENSDGYLIGMYNSDGIIYADAQNYVMQYNSTAGKPEFRQVKTPDFTTTAYRSYLKLNANNESRVVITFEGEDPTAITAIEAAEVENGALKDGKYLINGRIVLVKNGVKYGANGQKLN